MQAHRRCAPGPEHHDLLHHATITCRWAPPRYRCGRRDLHVNGSCTVSPRTVPWEPALNTQTQPPRGRAAGASHSGMRSHPSLPRDADHKKAKRGSGHSEKRRKEADVGSRLRVHTEEERQALREGWAKGAGEGAFLGYIANFLTAVFAQVRMCLKRGSIQQGKAGSGGEPASSKGVQIHAIGRACHRPGAVRAARISGTLKGPRRRNVPDPPGRNRAATSAGHRRLRSSGRGSVPDRAGHARAPHRARCDTRSW